MLLWWCQIDSGTPGLVRRSGRWWVWPRLGTQERPWFTHPKGKRDRMVKTIVSVP